MKFTPFKFQVPLAAGGIALMAFTYLQFAVPHGQGLIKLSDIPWGGLTTGQTILYLPLIGIMSIFTVISLVSIVLFSKDLIQWLFNKSEYDEFISGPPSLSVGVFVPIAALSMIANVILAPLAFFIPKLSSSVQNLMFPALIFFGFLWFTLFMLEFKFLKGWLTQPLDAAKLNFVWLVDVFAFGLVNLTGTGIASMSNNKEISSIAAFASLIALSFGLCLLVTKLSYLIYLQLKSVSLPQNAVLPSYFIMIPITCLFGISLLRVTEYLQKYFNFDIEVMSFFLLNFSYVIAIGWGIFSIYLLTGYFKDYFYGSEYSSTQWAMV
ncbi:MAG: hypothetical protein CVU89_15835 [Firmicutes bacterium HGW-Firmicutes-14]|nr:MAG: hypothetical protein CVU89_15835 [Firmicutes bacterium HGW-Firmicutes-14]